MAKQPKKGANEQASKGTKTPKPGNQKVNPEKPSIGAFEIADKGTKDFNIRPLPKVDVLPPGQVKLQQAIYAVSTVLKAVFKKEPDKYEKYIPVLMQVAEAGLEHPKTVHPEMALFALEQIKTEIVLVLGRELKKQYLVSLLKQATGLGGAALIVTLSLDQLWPDIFRILPFGLVWAGAMTGVWISVAMKQTTMSFEELPTYDEKKITPILHLIFAGIITTIFALLLKLGFFPITIDGHEIGKFYESIELSLVLGIFGGFSEKALSLKILKKAQQVFGGEEK